MVAVVKQAIAIRQKIQWNIFSDENSDGLLTRPEVEYFKCLEVGQAELKNLLIEDSEYWTENLKNCSYDI